MEERRNPQGEDSSSGGVVSPDPFDDEGSKSDGDYASPSSRYSSCGESEFERYCSANSVMGTPSLCSSVHYTDCLDSDFGSFRSLGDDNSLDGFSLGGRSGRNSERNLRVRFSQGHSTCRESDPIPCLCDRLLGALNGAESRILKEQNLFEARDPTLSNLGSEGSGSLIISKSISDDKMLLGGEKDEDGGVESLKYGHLDYEDTVCSYSSDDNSHKNLFYLNNINRDLKGRHEGDTLLMDSSVAFGEDDWNDFVQETGEAEVDPLLFATLCESRGENLQTQGNPRYIPSETLIDPLVTGKFEEEKDLKDLPLGRDLYPDHGSRNRKVVSVDPSGSKESAGTGRQNIGSCRRNNNKSSATRVSTWNSHYQHLEDLPDSSQSSKQIRVADESEEYLNSCSITNIFGQDQGPIMVKAHSELEVDPRVEEISKEVDDPCTNHEKLINVNCIQCMEDIKLESINTQLDIHSDSTADQLSFLPMVPLNIKTDFSNEKQNSSEVIGVATQQAKSSTGFSHSTHMYEEDNSSTKMENVELSEFLDDVLHDMEEILLDSSESPGDRFSHQKRTSDLVLNPSSRDGSLTATTSGFNGAETFIKQKRRIDAAEVIGARQRKGDVSLSERLVGVKEYTVYKIRVWSGNDQWEVERRYRDFLTLYHRLKLLVTEKGGTLPSEWYSIDRESRKLFGSASPDVVSERSALIERCLQSVIQSRIFSRTPNALLWFLSPQDSHSVPRSLGNNNMLDYQTTSFNELAETESFSNLGKTIPLIVEIRPHKSMKQLMEEQHHCCAGCRRHFDEGRTLVRDFVQTLGWGKPRFCDYMGQLFCPSCHTNETAVLPARVLHYWDFAEYPVCQLAKSYLDSIQDKPVLCVSAVNPFLLSRVPGLFHVMGIRKKIRSMLPFVRCPFRRSINHGLGCRIYLLESNDFFALRDLIDLSKGAFAALPTMLETVSRKILKHITDECLICCDIGLPCSAKQACVDPSSLIFPFQEDEVERCTFCKLVYHMQCFKKLGRCQCQTQPGTHDEAQDPFKMELSGGSSGSLGRRSQSILSTGLLPMLFPKVNSSRTKYHGDDNNTILLMDSLPSSSF
ncbi:hypothetical protein SAY86_011944 [Trapa natans]|uniref:PX domain-containing protein n=1 Tax=Trapa natans TaxID=22666 RepID=A0AAN7LWF4_TRANT|nr:hypothetical protein SAY86_011944 [Trapa natans]